METEMASLVFLYCIEQLEWAHALGCMEAIPYCLW